MEILYKFQEIGLIQFFFKSFKCMDTINTNKLINHHVNILPMNIIQFKNYHHTKCSA